MTDTTATTAHTEVAAEAKGGLPQFDSSTYLNQAVWLTISLVAIYFLLSRIALPRIGKVLDTRSQTIQSDLDAASDLRNKAKQAEVDYNTKLVNARAEAQKIIEANKANAQVEFDKAIAIADADLAKQNEISLEHIAKMQASAEVSIAEIAKDVSSAVVDSVSPASNDVGLIGKMLDKAMKG